MVLVSDTSRAIRRSLAGPRDRSCSWGRSDSRGENEKFRAPLCWKPISY